MLLRLPCAAGAVFYLVHFQHEGSYYRFLLLGGYPSAY